MENIFLKAYAKINLNLHLIPDIIEKGFYRVNFINAQLGIYDSIKISKNNKKEINIWLTSNKKYDFQDLNISKNENLAYKAAELIIKEFNIDKGVDIEIEKNIPVKAGLGGGSCDAAMVINGMNNLFSLNLSPVKKIKIAEKLGMDVCYCVIGGLCLVDGIGNIINPVPFPPPKIENVLLVLPDEKKPSTAWAYSKIDKYEIGKNVYKLDKLLNGILKRDIITICKNIWNDFEKPISKYYPKIPNIIRRLKKDGACSATLAGSGLTVFAIFENKKNMLKAKENMNSLGYKCINTNIF